MLAAISTLVLYLFWAAPSSIPAFLLARFLPGSRPWFRYVATVVVFTLFVTPSLGSATIALVSIPFAFILLATVISFHLSGLIWTLQEWPLWHAVAFPATLLVALVIFRRLRPNYSLKRTAADGLR